MSSRWAREEPVGYCCEPCLSSGLAPPLAFLFSLAQGVYAWDESVDGLRLSPIHGASRGLEASATWLKPTR
jgi:hypothetical protein